MEFCHLHCHTQYSLLDGAAEIGTMMDKAVADGQKGVALTDHGNMFGAFKFVNEAAKRNIKPMIGCEFYLVENRHIKAFSRAAGEKDKRYHQLMLAKNKQGYINLSKLCSIGYIEGLYGKYPRIDKELIEKYHEGLIVTSCCIGAEIPQLLIQGKDEEAEKALKWWLNIFGDDYYIEIQRHRGIDDIDLGKDREGRTIYSGKSQEDINVKLLALAQKHNVKVICTNDSHYVEEEDFMPHDILLCVNTGSLKDDPTRFKFPSSDFYFKKQMEMVNLFHDHPESVANTMEIYDKIETLKLASDVLLPNFPMPAEFATQDEYLRFLTYEGARKRYGEINEATRERLDFELDVIKASGYPGYFLIVQDFTTAARKMGVSVGPGRGSAAGSAVAYCVGITNVDPIKYDLLFERFLNPERVSMPDIDIDFDDVGRQKVIDYVIDKYGQEQVAQIITYGTMAAKSSLRDVGRVMDVPLSEVDRVAKSFPQQLGASLRDVLADGDISPKLKGKMNSEDVERAYAFRDLSAQPDEIGEMIRTAKKLEGSIRNTGIHACGVVITPSNITEHVPVTADKETGMYISQFDNSVAEDAGLLKMDFLGLKTLTIIKDALVMIKENHGKDIDIDDIPLDDLATYELFQRGETNGIFQYESGGMQKHMKNLKPTTFDDLIAMNALYRPGPLEYIPEFIERKHGRSPIVYDLDAMEEFLHETYGICVTGDTLVHNAETGERVRIDELSDRVGNFICQGVDDEFKSATGYLTHWVCNGMKPVYEVKLRSGKKARMTDNHRVLTEGGWRELKGISVGEFIGTPRKVSTSNEKLVPSFDQDRLRVLAYLIADGSLSSVGSTADFVNKSDCLIEAYKRSVLNGFERLEIVSLTQVRDVFRVSVKGTEKEHCHETNSLVAWLRELGLKSMTGGCRSDEKFIPAFVFELSLNDIAFFLACYWDCDGHKADKFTHIKTISPYLAEGIQTLLLRLGIHSTIYETTYQSNRRTGLTKAYQITVYDLDKFREKIGCLSLAKPLGTSNFRGQMASNSISRNRFVNEIKKTWKGSARKLTEEHGIDRQHFMPAKMNARPRIGTHVAESAVLELELPQTEKAIRVKWDEIISITPVGEELVYDISVSGIHNFVGNNILLHNCVYQEQVMLLSQKLANFSKGQADTLRKAMGKKQKAVLDKMYPAFLEGGKDNGHDEEKLGKIWKDWEAFASYAFNKSHSTCYALVAYQTAYLKAHYPAEYMASVLTHNKTDITKLTFFLRECKRMGLTVLGPDVNESESEFSVNKKGAIRIGMTALKGVGEGPVIGMLEARKEGPFESLFDMLLRLDTGTVNKRVLEALCMAGGFDCFPDVHRAQYFAPSEKYDSYLEHVVKFANAYQAQKASAASSLFGAIQEEVLPKEPVPPYAKEWPLPVKLDKEKDVTGIYVSGHPLDGYRMEVENFTTCTLAEVDPRKHGRTTLNLAGMITLARHMISKNGNGWGIFELSDFDETIEFKLFGDDYQKYRHLLEPGKALFVKANYKQKWNSDEMELSISEVKLLEGLGREMTSGIELKLPLNIIDPKMVAQLDAICRKYPGNAKLRMTFLDHEGGYKLKMAAMERTVDADNDFIGEIERLGIGYELERA